MKLNFSVNFAPVPVVNLSSHPASIETSSYTNFFSNSGSFLEKIVFLAQWIWPLNSAKLASYFAGFLKIFNFNFLASFLSKYNTKA